MLPITYEQFYEKVMGFTMDDFADFCHRYQKILFRFFRATKATYLGDLGNDGIITPLKRLACYGFFIDTVDKDGRVAAKLKDDFDNMMKNHPRTRRMVFMTKTEGIGPKTQKMLERLTSREYLENQLSEWLPSASENLVKNYVRKRIEYVDIKDMFEHLRDIKKGETWEYLLNHTLWVEPPMTLPDKQLDDPAFMAEWLSVAVKRFDNPEAPVFLQYDQLHILKQSIVDKVKRDLRKYEVKSFKDLPYVPWLLLAFFTPNSETSIAFSPSFEVPKLLWESDTEVLQMELTPLLLLNIVERIIKIFTRPNKITENTDPLFTDLFLQAWYQIENEYPFADRTKMVFHNFRESKKWQAAFTAFVRNNDDNEKTGVPSG